MKKVQIFIVSCLVLCISFEKMHANNSQGASCSLHDGIATTTWLTLDSNSNTHVMSARGSLATDPTLWVQQDLSTDVNGYTSVTPAYLYRHPANGNVVAVWQYFDATLSIVRVAAATLPENETTWTVQTVSSNVTTETAGFGDESVSVDENGNIMITWTSFDNGSDKTLIRAVTGVISGSSTTWGSSYIFPGQEPALTKKTAPVKLPASIVQKPKALPTPAAVKTPSIVPAPTTKPATTPQPKTLAPKVQQAGKQLGKQQPKTQQPITLAPSTTKPQVLPIKK